MRKESRREMLTQVRGKEYWDEGGSKAMKEEKVVSEPWQSRNKRSRRERVNRYKLSDGSSPKANNFSPLPFSFSSSPLKDIHLLLSNSVILITCIVVSNGLCNVNGTTQI